MTINLKKWINWLLVNLGSLFKKLEGPARIANEVVQKIKEYVQNPVVDLLTLLDRSGIAKNVLSIIKAYLPSAIEAILVAQNIISAGAAMNWGALLKLFVEVIGNLADGQKTPFWSGLSILFARFINEYSNNNKKLPDAAYMTVTQGLYAKEYLQVA